MGEGAPVVSDLPGWLPRHLLTVPEASELLRVSTRHLRRLIKSGRLRVAHIGRRVLIPPDALADLLRANDP